PTILVTGATGKTGGAVVAQLREQGWPVRAVVHKCDARSEKLDRLGAETVVADLFDPCQILEAMRGASRAYYCPPWHPYMVQSATAFALAAREARLEAIVGLTQWLASRSHPSLATRQNWLVDHLFSMLPGIAHVSVNPGFFADNYLRLTPFAAHLGIFPWPTGESRNAPPSTEDIARVAVAALMDPARHAERSYRPTGPELLSARDMASALARVLKRRVMHIDMPMWMFLKAMRALGISPFEQLGVRSYIEEHQAGAFEFSAPTDHVLEVTGRAPEDFETIARRYAALPAARRTVGNGLRALADFMRIGLTRAHDLDRFEREQLHPVPPSPRFAIKDERWQIEHSV
ncbi:MAG: NmrA family NAD(P)-binding protein, partial [Rhizobiaceae bacterium]